MKLTALAVVILALGIVVGFALAGGSLGGPASAIPKCPGPSSQCATPTPEPPKQREDQIVLLASGGASGGVAACGLVNYVPVGYQGCPPRVGDEHLTSVQLDASRYPNGATFELEVTFTVRVDSTFCARLFDNSANMSVAGSEICISNADPAVEVSGRFRSGTFMLAGEEHEYVTEIVGTGRMTTARIIVKWTE